MAKKNEKKIVRKGLFANSSLDYEPELKAKFAKNRLLEQYVRERPASIGVKVGTLIRDGLVRQVECDAISGLGYNSECYPDTKEVKDDNEPTE